LRNVLLEDAITGQAVPKQRRPRPRLEYSSVFAGKLIEGSRFGFGYGLDIHDGVSLSAGPPRMSAHSCHFVDEGNQTGTLVGKREKRLVPVTGGFLA
jgi:hypothetical protein